MAPEEPENQSQPVKVSLAARPLIFLVRIYQALGRPFLGGQCRFYPTCSDYAVEALRVHGAIRGSWLAIWRILRCQPLCAGGFDPVPPKRSKNGEYSPDP
jgi:putative membrane protein insertion efficiency factor